MGHLYVPDQRMDDRPDSSWSATTREPVDVSKRYRINQRTAARSRKRTSAADLPTIPKEQRSTALSVDEEAVIIVFRSYAILPLGHCLYAPQPTIPIPRARRCTAAIESGRHHHHPMQHNLHRARGRCSAQHRTGHSRLSLSSSSTWEHVNLTGDSHWEDKPALDEIGFRPIPFTL